MSQVRQNFHNDSEALINKQINMELQTSYVYLSMSAYFNRDDVALHGFAHFFSDFSHEEREHAENFIKYQNMRGGRVVFQNVDKPSTEDWGSALGAVKAALELEKSVNASLLNLHGVANDHKDAQLCDFIESDYLEEQVKSIKKLGDMITKMNRAGETVGLHIIDKELHS